MSKGSDQAFPFVESTEKAVYEMSSEKLHRGMTKREYFAARALQGLLSSNNAQTTSYLVQRSIKAADELIEQLNQNTKQDEYRN